MNSIEVVGITLSKNTDLDSVGRLCFDGKTVYANNETIGIVAPYRTKLKGSVSGNPLIALIRNVGDIDLIEKGELVIAKKRKGATKLTMRLGELTPFPYRMEDDSVIELKEGYGALIRNVMVSMGTDGGKPDILGCSMVLSRGKILFVSSNNVSATKVTIKCHAMEEKCYTMPPIFWEAFDKILGGGYQLEAVGYADNMVAFYFSGSVVLIGRTLEGTNPNKILDTIDDMYSMDDGFQVPTNLLESLKRTSIVSTEQNQQTQIRVKDRYIHLDTVGALGEVRDRVKVDSDISTELATLPYYLCKVLPIATKLSLAESAISVKGKNLIGVVVAYPIERERP